MKKFSALLLLVAAVLSIGCQKELSYEAGKNLSKGSLQSQTTGDCLPKTVEGNFIAGITLSPVLNTITVAVDVTMPGRYTIYTDTINGYFFSSTGVFVTTGINTVTLKSNGKPLSMGANNFAVNYDGATCNISVNVTGATLGTAVFTASCGTSVINGAYQAGSALRAINSIIIPIVVSTPGTYDVTYSNNGMTFKGNGSLSLTNDYIELTGTGVPDAAGVTNIAIPGVVPCNIPINVLAAPATIDWKFNVGSLTYKGNSVLSSINYNTSSAPLSVLDYSGDNMVYDYISFTLIDLDGGGLEGEQYDSHPTGSTNIGAFSFYELGSVLKFSSDPYNGITNMIFKITTHNNATKTIIGTFSGTALNVASNTPVTISNGTFTVVYQ